MPKRLFNLIEEMAWSSKTSINIKLDDLIVTALIEKLLKKNVDITLAMYTGKKEGNDLHFLEESLDNAKLHDEKIEELFEIIREYRDWRETSI